MNLGPRTLFSRNQRFREKISEIAAPEGFLFPVLYKPQRLRWLAFMYTGHYLYTNLC